MSLEIKMNVHLEVADLDHPGSDDERRGMEIAAREAKQFAAELVPIFEREGLSVKIMEVDEPAGR